MSTVPAAIAPPVAAARSTDAAPVPFADLPLAIQQEIPKLSIQFHMYSRNPANRMVGINNRMQHEGDQVEPGLTLEQITADGMVLRYKEYRFLAGTR
jgi:general secretion pathway protein B